LLFGGKGENPLAALEVRRVDPERACLRGFVHERLKQVGHVVLSTDERRQAEKAHPRVRLERNLLVE
jgi:hypothetical protein